MPLVLSKQNQLRQLVIERRLDADALFAKKRYNGSVYMAGYAVECALKAAVCRQLKEPRMRAVLASHDLDLLVGKSPRSEIPRIMLWGDMQKEPKLLRAFEQVSDVWTSGLRYETRYVDRQTAADLLSAAEQLTSWLGSQYPGVEG